MRSGKIFLNYTDMHRIAFYVNMHLQCTTDYTLLETLDGPVYYEHNVNPTLCLMEGK
jgi:hypothetical protein